MFPNQMIPKFFSDTVDMAPVNDMDVREITVITADGETILLATKRRTESLPRKDNYDQRKLSVLTDSTIAPQKLSMRNESVVPVERTPVILEDEEQKSEHASIEQKNENKEVAANDNIENGTTFLDIQNSKIVITTVKEEVVPDDDGKDKVITTKIEEQVVIESDEEENNDREVKVVTPAKKEDNSYVDLLDNNKKENDNTPEPSVHENQDNDMIGASISMVKPFHLDNETSTHLIEENTKNIDLPLINENVKSTSSKNNLLTVPAQNEPKPEEKIPLVKMSKDDIEKRKLSYKKKPLKTSLKNSVYAIRYFRKPKEEEAPPQYVVVEDFQKFKENTEKCINENSRNLEANTTTMNESNEKFRDSVKENFDEMKSSIENLNNDYAEENKKLKEEIVVLKNRIVTLEEEREKEMEQLRNEVAEEIIKLQNSIKSLEVDKDREIEQLRNEIEDLHQRDDNYQEVIEHHLLTINTSLVKLKEENMMLKEENMMNKKEICNEIHKIKENKIMEIDPDTLVKQKDIETISGEIQKMKENKIMDTNPDNLVKQEELENISKQIIKSNVQWNELCHDVQNIPAQLKKDVDDKFETFEKDQQEKSQQFENFITDTKRNQGKLEKCIKELIKLQKANENSLETQTRSIHETIALQGQQIQDFENTRNQIWAQNERLNNIGDRVDHYCTNDYLDTVIELEDLRKITNRTTEELFNLQKLNLYCKNLDRLPKRIFSLENLNELWLGRNNLNNLNDKVGNLKNLKRLSVADNNLSQLPTGIKNLKNLTHLYLYKNKLKELPPEIGELENLIHLDVESNKLTKLPEELKKLTN